jgi:hypothetical protein
MLEVVLRERKYQTMLAETPDGTDGASGSPLKDLLQILEAVDDIESKKLVLQIVTHVAETPANRLHVARAKGPKRILRLLLIKDEDLFYDVMQTVRLFLVVPETNSDDVSTISTPSRLEGDAVTKQPEQPDAIVGLLSMFRELGKLMPWVEGNGEEIQGSAGDTNSNGVVSRNGGGDRLPTGSDHSQNVRPGSNADQISSLKVEGIAEEVSGSVVARPSTKELSEHFIKAKAALQENSFLNHVDVVSGPGHDHDRSVSMMSRSSEISHSTSSSASSASSASSFNNAGSTLFSTSPELLSKSFLNSGAEGVVFQEFMRSQGALRVLTQMLQQELEEDIVRPEQVLEVLGALQIMLGDNDATDDFAKFGGYVILTNIPAKLVSTQLGSRQIGRASGRDRVY